VPRIEWLEGSREELEPLFALADDSPAQVRSYRDLGRVLVAREGPELVGHVQLVGGKGDCEIELRSIAVREQRQRAGVGRRLLERAIAVAREEGVATLVVATAAADVKAVRFYQRLGFRMLRIERDVFTREAGYPEVDLDGIPLRDQLWLSLSLASEDDSRVAIRVQQLRVARHTEQLDELVRFYRDGIGLVEVGSFHDHDGYDGVFLEIPGTGAHLELTAGGDRRPPSPHPESLLVLYLGCKAAVEARAARLGTDPVDPANPYWAEHGKTFEDPDGFRVVLVPETWRPG
jgi:GNAT superfamily N-acetyltransferase/catechol 2,3-dioxygenase-like lactoylglutathione lyase family enzyme